MDDKATWLLDLGRRISAARGSRTQAAVASDAEMAPNTLARIERGELEPGAWAMARLAVAIGVSADRLLGIG